MTWLLLAIARILVDLSFFASKFNRFVKIVVTFLTQVDTYGGVEKPNKKNLRSDELVNLSN